MLFRLGNHFLVKYLYRQTPAYVPFSNESIVVEGYFRLIQNRYEAHVDYAIIRSLISAFILELNQMFAIRVEHKKLKISRKEDILWRFLSLLTQHYKENRSVDFYADKLCISPKHLSSVIKQLSHKTAHEIIPTSLLWPPNNS